MIDFETSQRLAKIHERLILATHDEIRRDGHHKSSEAAMEITFHLPSAFDDETQWSVWAYSYLLCPDGRQKRWFGKSAIEAVSKAEDGIRRWISLRQFENDIEAQQAGENE